MLNVGPVDVAAGKFQVGFDRLACIAGIANDQSADDKHLVAVQVVDGFEGGVSGVLAVRTLRVLGGGPEEFKIALQDVFDAEEDIAESGPSHQRRESFAVVRNRRRHGLYKVIEFVQPGGNNGLAQGLESMHIQRNVVVDEEDGSSAVVARVANVVQHAIERVG